MLSHNSAQNKKNCQDRSNNKSIKKKSTLDLGPKIFLLSVSHVFSLHIHYSLGTKSCKEIFYIFCRNKIKNYYGKGPLRGNTLQEKPRDIINEKHGSDDRPCHDYH